MLQLGEKDGGRRMRRFNYDTLKDRHWDSEILGLVAQIHEFKGRQELYLKQKPAALDRCLGNFMSA